MMAKSVEAVTDGQVDSGVSVNDENDSPERERNRAPLNFPNHPHHVPQSPYQDSNVDHRFIILSPTRHRQ